MDSQSWREWWDAHSHDESCHDQLDKDVFFRNKLSKEIADKELLEFINPATNERVFDAGCGNGIHILRLNDRVKEIVGMDASEGMVERAKARIIAEGIKNARVTFGTVTEIGEESHTFDKALCLSVLQYVNDEDCKKALKELIRILKDGGILILHVKNLSSLYTASLYFAKKIKRLFAKDVKIPYYRTFKWYERELNKLDARVIDYNSFNIISAEIFPRFLQHWLQEIEVRHYKGWFYRIGFVRRRGADLKLKAIVHMRRD